MLQTNRIYQLDCRDGLGMLGDESIDCVITSPPYWGLRDYGLEPLVWDGRAAGCDEHEWGDGSVLHTGNAPSRNTTLTGGMGIRASDSVVSQGQFCSLCGAWRGSLGLEPTFQLYIQHLIQIFNEVKRVLKPTGTCFVNLGDSYGGSGGSAGHTPETKNLGRKTFEYGAYPSSAINKGTIPKSLCQIPSRFAIAMTDAGWLLRNEIIWYKRNCMPSSAKDRFTVDFEKMFFFSKNNKSLYWTHPRKQIRSLVKLLINYKKTNRKPKPDYVWKHKNTDLVVDYPPVSDRILREFWKRKNLWRGHDYWFEQQFEPHLTQESRPDGYDSKLNKMKVPSGWDTKSGSHGTIHRDGRSDPEYKDVPLDPKGRNKRCVWDITTTQFKGAHFAVFPPALVEIPILSGCPENGIVLDPFAGSGTTGSVALKLNRNFILFDSNPEYCEMTNKRLKEEQMQMKMELS